MCQIHRPRSGIQVPLVLYFEPLTLQRGLALKSKRRHRASCVLCGLQKRETHKVVDFAAEEYHGTAAVELAQLALGADVALLRVRTAESRRAVDRAPEG